MVFMETQSAVLSPSDQNVPSSTQYVSVCFEDANFKVREGTSDARMLEEVFKQHLYRRTRPYSFDVESGETWLDVGSHIGGFLIYANNRGASVHGFEPSPDSFSLCVENLLLNNRLNVPVEKKAVALVDGKRAFNLEHADTGGHSFFDVKKPEASIEVDTVDARPLWKQYDCIKLDAEGIEMELLDADLDWSGIKKLAMEYHFRHDKSLSNFHRRMQVLRDAGMTLMAPDKLPQEGDFRYFPDVKMVYGIRI